MSRKCSEALLCNTHNFKIVFLNGLLKTFKTKNRVFKILDMKGMGNKEI